MPDHSYEAAYAAWQAELREAARRPDREEGPRVATRTVRGRRHATWRWLRARPGR